MMPDFHVRIAFPEPDPTSLCREDDQDIEEEIPEEEFDFSPNPLDSKTPEIKTVDILVIESGEKVSVKTRQLPWNYRWLQATLRLDRATTDQSAVSQIEDGSFQLTEYLLVQSRGDEGRAAINLLLNDVSSGALVEERRRFDSFLSSQRPAELHLGETRNNKCCLFICMVRFR